MRRLVILGAAITFVGAMSAVMVGSGGNGNFTHFRADLSGDNEVPPVETETTGEFRLKFANDFSSAEYRLDVNDGTRITQAHIHCGEEGVNGPVVVFLAGFHANGWNVDGRWIDNAFITDANIVNTACGETLMELAMAIASGDAYVNVHSTEHPGGVVRGQID